MKILVCCGNGIGSSLMLEMSVKKVLKEIGKTAEVEHSDLSSAKSIKADIYMATRDIATQLVGLDGIIVSLVSMVNKKDLRDKLEAAIAEYEAK